MIFEAVAVHIFKQSAKRVFGSADVQTGYDVHDAHFGQSRHRTLTVHPSISSIRRSYASSEDASENTCARTRSASAG